MADGPNLSNGARRLEAAQTLCALAIVALACLRAIVGFEPIPWWNSDPFESQVFSTGITPAHALWLDAAALAIAGAGLALFTRAGHRPRRAILLLGALGTLAAAFWSVRPAPGNTIDSMRLAWAWISAVWSAVALAHLCHDPRRRALAMAMLLGVVAMLAAKGVVQVLVEHADTIAWYERDPETFLRAHGWEPGSAQARGYERRLYQTEATGWFGLSNVYATVVGACGVGLAAMAVVAVIERHRAGVCAALGAGAVTGIAGLWLCGSKGGAVAAVAGAGLVAAAWIAGRWLGRRQAGQTPSRLRIAAALIALTAGLAPIAATLARGLLGERLSELSLLFRWFYTQGAARVVTDHWPIGVGPAGFRDAYLLVRPPLAVEDVISPHSLPWDLLTSFGVIGGGAWFALLIVLVAAAAAGWLRSARPSPLDPTPPPPESRDDIKLIALLAIVATAVAASFERILTTPETALLRIAGLALWVVVAWAVLAAARHSPRALAAAVCAAGAVVLLHAGIEVTPTWVGAQTWALAILGVAGAAAATPAPDLPRPSPRIAPAVIAVCTLGLLAIAPWGVARWQSRLREAWAAASDVGRLQDQMRVLDADPALAVELGVSAEGVRRELAALVGASPARTPAEFEGQLAALVEQRSREVLDILSTAAHPADVPTRRAADRAAQRLAGVLVESDRLDAAAELLGTRINLVQDAPTYGWTVALRSHVGSLLNLRAEILDRAGHPEDARAARLLARDSYEAAAALDPRGVHHPVRAARLSARLGESQAAADWARRALDNHANSRLDPLMGLSEAESSEMEALVAAAVPPG